MGIAELQALLADHPGLVSFAGAFFGGSSVTLFLATLAGQGILPWPVLLGYAAAGNFASDGVWYWVGRSRWARALTASPRAETGYARVDELAGRYRQHHLALFVLVKFAYGLRVIAILYFGRARYPLGRFLAFDALAVLAINGAVVASGWGMGKGLGLFFDVFRSVRTVTTFALVFFVVWLVLRAGADRRRARV